MDLEVTAASTSSLPPSRPKDMVKCCDCGCSCSLVLSSSSAGSWIRSVKRKYDEFEDGNRFFIPGFDFFSNPRVQIENECAALRETVSSQQLTIQELLTELDEERNASSTAANEAMSMILRLQREKAEIQMEARQFKRFTEEKMAHDQQEFQALEDVLYKREQAIQSLTCETQAYKHRMLSYGLTEEEVEGERERSDRTGFSRNPSMTESSDAALFEYPAYNYPPLKCNLNENPTNFEGDDDIVDIEKYAFGETPRPQQKLKNLEFRINQMEKNTSNSQSDGEFSGGKNVLEKIIVGYSPRRPRPSRMFSGDVSNSPMGTSREVGPDFVAESPTFNNSFKKMDYVSHSENYSNLRKVDNASDFGDDTSDRIYTIDSVYTWPYNGVSESKDGGIGVYEDNISSPRDIFRPDISDPDVKKLYMRLQALEADRESMRQALLSMRTDKAQMVLLKEIAQHLCKEMSPERRIAVKKPSILGAFSFMSVFKWVASLMFWRKKAHRSKYMCGLSASNVGLLLLLDKGPHTRQWRCLSSTQV